MKMPNSMQQLNILQKFCDNQINFSDFINAKEIIDDDYALQKWKRFQMNPLKFITSYSDIKLYKWIIDQIDLRNYKG